MASTIRIAILANAVNAVRGLRATTSEAEKVDRKVKQLDRTIRKIDGRKVKVQFDAVGFTQGIAQMVLARIAVDKLRKGLPDLSFGLTGVAQKSALAVGGALALTGAFLPLVGATLGLGAAVAGAAAGVGLFGAVAFPTIKAVTTAVTEYNTASHAFDRAQAIGDTKKMALAQDQMRSALGALAPAERASAQQLIAMNTAWTTLSRSQAPLVLGILTAGAKTLAGIIPRLTPAISAMATAIKDVSGPAFSQLSASIGPIVDLIKGPGVESFRLLATIAANIVPTVEHLVTAFAPVGVQILKAIVPVTDAMRSIDFTPFATAASALLPAVGALFGNLSGAIASVVKASQPLAGPVLQALSDVAAALAAAFAGPEIKSFVASIVKIIPSVAPILTIVINAFASFAAIIAQQLIPLLPRLTPLVAKIADVFVNVLTGLSPILPVLLDFVGLLVGLLPTIFPIITAMRDALVPVIGQLGQALIIIAPSLPPLVVSFGQIVDAITPMLPLLAQMAGVLAGGLTSALTTLAPLVAGVVGFLADHPAFAGALAGAAVAIGSIVAATKAWTAAQVALDAAMDANPVGLIILAVAALVAGIIYLATKTQFFQTVWHGLVDVITSAANFIIGLGARFGLAIRGMVDYLIKIVTSIPAGMAKVGTDIVNGLIFGLQSVWRGFIDILKGLVNLIPLTIRKALGIASPSKVMAGIGKQITLGLAGGIVNGVPALRSSLGALSDEITGFAASPSIAAPVAITGGGRTISTTYAINVNVPPTSDLAAVGQATVNAIKAHERRTGRSVLVPAL